MHVDSFRVPGGLGRCWRGLEFRWAFGQQRLGLEGTVACVVAFYYYVYSRTENVGHNAVIDDCKRLYTLPNHKTHRLCLVVTHNRPLLDDSLYTYRLGYAGGATL